jgi:hypothetical protein
MTARLGVVCAFTATFSVCLSLVTEARRVENFAATAAYVIPSFVLEVNADSYEIGLPVSRLCSWEVRTRCCVETWYVVNVS